MRAAIRMESAEGPGAPGSAWWYMQAGDTGVVLGVENPRMEPDDEAIYPEYDSIVIVADGQHRAATAEEYDEYVDDVREYLRLSDWS